MGFRARRARKSWKPKFWKRKPLEEEPFLRKRRDVARGGDALDLFLYDNDSSFSFVTEVIEDLCLKYHTLRGNTSRLRPEVAPLCAWVDLRSLYETDHETHTGWYTAADLKNIMNQTLSVGRLPQSYRHLLFFPDLDPDSVTTLACSTLHHQVGALRDALYNHIACKASMRVIIPVAGFSTFRLEFSLPQLALKEIPVRAGQRGEDTFQSGSPDISFLKLQCKSKDSQLVLFESQFTLSIIGWDGMKWTAYAFGGNGPVDDNEDDEDSDSDSVPEDQPAEDCIASTCGQILDTEEPIWDSRSYWLRNIEMKIEKTTDDWGKILHYMEKGSKEWKMKRPLRFQSARPIYEEALEWIMQAIVLFGELSQRLSITAQTIKRFIAPGGDSDYFADMTDDTAVRALHNIRNYSEKLQDLYASLRSLENMCQQVAKTIELQMNMENSRLSLRSSQLSHEANATALKTHRVAMRQTQMSFSNNLNAILMLSTNQVMTPVVIVTAYYSTQAPVFGFPRNGKTFIIAVVIVYFVLRTFNIATVLARRYIRSNRILALIALGQLEKLFDLETENELKELV